MTGRGNMDIEQIAEDIGFIFTVIAMICLTIILIMAANGAFKPQ